MLVGGVATLCINSGLNSDWCRHYRSITHLLVHVCPYLDCSVKESSLSGRARVDRGQLPPEQVPHMLDGVEAWRGRRMTQEAFGGLPGGKDGQGDAAGVFADEERW